MKREEIKAMLGEGAADEVVDKLLNAMHTEIEQHKKAAKTAQDALAEKVKEIGELSQKTVDADALKQSLAELQAKYDADTKAAAEQLAQIEFDSDVKDAATRHGARNEKAVRAMLDLDALKGSKNRREDIDKAMTELKKSDAYLFGAEPTGLKRDVGVNIVPPPALGGSPAQPDETGGFPPACPASAKDKTGPSPGRFRFQSAALIDGRPAFRGTPEKRLSGGNEPGEAAPQRQTAPGRIPAGPAAPVQPPDRRPRSAVFAPHTAATPSSNGRSAAGGDCRMGPVQSPAAHRPFPWPGMQSAARQSGRAALFVPSMPPERKAPLRCAPRSGRCSAQAARLNGRRRRP